MKWKDAFEACFREVQAPYLTEIRLRFGDDGTVFPWKFFDAAPEITTVQICLKDPTPLGAVVLQSITAALSRGVLQNLTELQLWRCSMGDGVIKDFMDALEATGCAMRLTTLYFALCGFRVEDVNAVVDLISRSAFSALQQISLIGNPNITDVGIMAFAEALLKSTQTRLEVLGLCDVGMGEEGIAALASLVSQGRMERLKRLDISANAALTQQGIITLASAIAARGLPMLEDLLMINLTNLTAVGIGAIALAVIKGCPRLTVIDFAGSGPENGSHRDAVAGMLEAAGRTGKFKVIYDKEA